MIPLTTPNTLTDALLATISEMLRRAVDGTIKPLFVDYTNQRVIIGGTSSAGQNAPLQVQSGDIEITTAGKGLILKDANGSGKTCRITATYDDEVDNWTLTIEHVS